MDVFILSVCLFHVNLHFPVVSWLRILLIFGSVDCSHLREPVADISRSDRSGVGSSTVSFCPLFSFAVKFGGRPF